MYTYLEEGDQTQITPQISQIAKDLDHGQSLDTVFEILRWIQTDLKFETEGKKEIFRTRTADQIISDGFYSGCTDATLVFVSLVRTCQIPAKYVEMLSKDWLECEDQDTFSGHVVSEAKIGEHWYFVDPIRAHVSLRCTSGMVIVDKGLDSWDIGITHDNWKEKMLGYRTTWKAKLN